MRSIWKGSISFGLVSIPIKVVSATENHSVSFRQVHTTDGGRIRYRKVCDLDGEEVPSEEIGKAYETADGSRIQLTDEDLASLPLPTAKTVEILSFVPAEEIDPIQLDRTYYLAGDGQSASKPYVLLREALNRSGKVAIAKLALRGRESLAMLRVYGDTLALHMMLWPDEIRSAEGMAPSGDVAVRDAELDLADTLMETLGELDRSELRDEYREALEALIAAKEQGEPVGEEGAGAPAASGGKVVDLMAVLESSVQAAKESHAEDAEATVHELRQQEGPAEAPAEAGSGGKRAARKSAQRKTAEKKSAAKQGAAKKTATKKTATKKTTAKKGATKRASEEPATRKKQTGQQPATKRAPRKSA
ncbi:Ku protein [Streptomyces oceani]|uniref:Non-homologous end joining protein Ku n=1 Tax=Streptomyces oceani TaxID=1075402 RepID=A0A1E7KFE4_9ACTN|nr:Ku protein [Streptomyces oceani]OEV02626.1 DNA repair protein [Streptomyces oceani]